MDVSTPNSTPTNVSNMSSPPRIILPFLSGMKEHGLLAPKNSHVSSSSVVLISIVFMTRTSPNGRNEINNVVVDMLIRRSHTVLDDHQSPVETQLFLIVAENILMNLNAVNVTNMMSVNLRDASDLRNDNDEDFDYRPPRGPPRRQLHRDDPDPFSDR